MAVDYYVLVSKMDSKNAIEKDLCGHLYSTHHVKAKAEAQEYADQLNGGWPLDVLLGEYYTVTVCPASTTRMRRGFGSFKRRRVTDKKWNIKK